MRWLRSWPAVEPPGRAHVIDDMERLVISDYDYSPLGAIDEDVALLEWDMAVSKEDRDRFERLVRLDPDSVLVAPYRLYMGKPEGRWAHRVIGPYGREEERWLETDELICDYFGFGMVYLPCQMVRHFIAAEAPERGRPPYVKPGDYGDSRMTDQTFSIWHRWRSGRRGVRVAWACRPVHLHY